MITDIPKHCPECGTELERIAVEGDEIVCPNCEAVLSDYARDATPTCARCGTEMLMMYGAGWDYDRWICGTPGCDFEIELDITTHVDDNGNPME